MHEYLDMNDENIRKKHMADLLRMRNEYGYYCMHPFASGDTCTEISGAHNIQRNGPLKKIQVNNHILSPLVNGFTGKLEMKSLGIATQATVFSGLCNEHDKIFYPIEHDILSGDLTSYQLFLFAYRAFAYTYFKIKREEYCFKKLSQKYNYHEQTFVQFYHNMIQKNVNKIEKEKEKFDSSITTNKYDDMTHFVHVLNYEIKFAASTGIVANFDIYGTKMKIDQNKLNILYISAFPSDNCSYIIISTYNENIGVYESFFNTIKNAPIKFLLKYLNNVLPLYAENIVLSPNLWEKWKKENQNEFVSLIQGNLIANKISSDSWQHFEKRGYNLFIEDI